MRPRGLAPYTRAVSPAAKTRKTCAGASPLCLGASRIGKVPRLFGFHLARRRRSPYIYHKSWEFPAEGVVVSGSGLQKLSYLLLLALILYVAVTGGG